MKFAVLGDWVVEEWRGSLVYSSPKAYLTERLKIEELFEGHYFCQAQREDFFQRAKPYNDHPTILRLPGKVLLQSR
ncbi:PREDICTED: N-carbamoylputrescine [Prunus dulcis]|uniref:PREDICTED: N-carbamoylputrescine n=2 Tax=Prunus dulcis TaxID=3755 RepID=A0A5E4F3K9_PRUDU|nr:hypothetical protein L3X38_041731 [Prunus dulcis]VVA22405.1 PREDICTED: N-carbamoylputrescine [Prunus dulcis]VVA22406.1 PREDICTED: N-carbamoylputrescine [Prunus dulcis]